MWGFIIPFISLVRPYQVMRDVADAVNPERVAEPPRRVDTARSGDYRTMAYVSVPPPKPLPKSVIGLWWATFVGMNLLGNFTSRLFAPGAGSSLDSIITSYGVVVTVNLLGVVSAALAIQVVRAITARIEERLRRIGLSTPEELAAQGVTLG